MNLQMAVLEVLEGGEDRPAPELTRSTRVPRGHSSNANRRSTFSASDRPNSRPERRVQARQSTDCDGPSLPLARQNSLPRSSIRLDCV